MTTFNVELNEDEMELLHNSLALYVQRQDFLAQQFGDKEITRADVLQAFGVEPTEIDREMKATLKEMFSGGMNDAMKLRAKLVDIAGDDLTEG